MFLTKMLRVVSCQPHKMRYPYGPLVVWVDTSNGNNGPEGTGTNNTNNTNESASHHYTYVTLGAIKPNDPCPAQCKYISGIQRTLRVQGSSSQALVRL